MGFCFLKSQTTMIAPKATTVSVLSAQTHSSRQPGLLEPVLLSGRLKKNYSMPPLRYCWLSEGKKGTVTKWIFIRRAQNTINFPYNKPIYIGLLTNRIKLFNKFADFFFPFCSSKGNLKQLWNKPASSALLQWTVIQSMIWYRAHFPPLLM